MRPLPDWSDAPMASKKDLVEAQGFSRRRLLTAFVSGLVYIIMKGSLNI